MTPLGDPGLRIMIATRPVDFRRGHDGLAAYAQMALGFAPQQGLVLVFRARRGDRLKIGPWTLIAGYPGETTFATIQTSDRPGEAEQLITVVDTGRENIHRRRLELLLDCAKRIGAAKDELTLAEGVLDVLAQGTGYTVVAIIRPIASASVAPIVRTRQ